MDTSKALIIGEARRYIGGQRFACCLHGVFNSKSSAQLQDSGSQQLPNGS
jgi:hypothetical protein